MESRQRTNRLSLVLSTAALVISVAFAGGPTLASAAGVFASNSDKVDGKHAVSSSASTTVRQGKLVATSPTTGRLPNNILAKAPDASRLDGLDSGAFATSLDGQSCPEGEFVTGVDQAGDLVCAEPGAVADVDGDGYPAAEDCDDSDGSINPGAPEVGGDGVDNNCDGTVDEGSATDADGDGYDDEVDCAPDNPSVNPGMPEITGDGGVDNDCDGMTDEDMDGYWAGPGVAGELDCDDFDPFTHPGATEVSDGVDNDCDGTVDETD